MTDHSRALRKVAAELATTIAELPFPPVARAISEQAEHPTEPAMQAILRAAREVLGSPAAAWDATELQALTLAPYDEALRAVLEERLDKRWSALSTVVRQLRASGAVDSSVDDDAAVLHVLAVGLGLAMLAPLSPKWSASDAWTTLAARLLESLAAIDPDLDDGDGTHRTWRARVTTSNNPAALARLLRVLALMRITVATMLTAPGEQGRQLVDLILRAPQNIERDTIAQAIASVGEQVIVARGLASDAEDIASRVLRLSAILANRPEAAPQGAADLVLGDSFAVVNAAEGPDASEHVLRLQWTVERHVVIHRSAPFTHAEFTRASALLELVEALSKARGSAEGFGWAQALPDGTRMWIRLARPQDAAPVEQMHARSSESSIYNRYFTPMNSWREENLRRISGGHRGATLVATVEGGTVVALGNIFPAGTEDALDGEIAVLVEDEWQHLGIGRQILQHLIEIAPRLGFAHVVAYVLAENDAMITLLRSLEQTWEVVADHDLGSTVVCLRAAVG